MKKKGGGGIWAFYVASWSSGRHSATGSGGPGMCVWNSLSETLCKALRALFVVGGWAGWWIFGRMVETMVGWLGGWVDERVGGQVGGRVDG